MTWVGGGARRGHGKAQPRCGRARSPVRSDEDVYTGIRSVPPEGKLGGPLEAGVLQWLVPPWDLSEEPSRGRRCGR